MSTSSPLSSLWLVSRYTVTVKPGASSRDSLCSSAITFSKPSARKCFTMIFDRYFATSTVIDRSIPASSCSSKWSSCACET